ncbi:SUMF1/EgtB/PvdO family nonheme iron enzyme [Tychonema sp. BBK16]|uniref:SUMF1/EgtB/PvdO family nonheme iron enzyme n=1 Tax=Tychonema sp. BBK16 TaxID=2699888 RepID=UPI001F3E1D99|nr:SUMF1/EgtB/PvdO family nonheme iron enzyme [Tychonema sp. BBK16]MCF6373975.1 SUMF1/EgtB/PvdO family nonheme iron enzyme [Tychonema sp. BBK16]
MGRNQAISIGINKYDYLIPLKYAKRDAELMQEFLRGASFEQVFFFSDDSPDFHGISTRPSRNNLRRFLRQISNKPTMEAGDNLWFFFSGHGMQYDGRDYLMPCDGDAEDVEHTAIPIDFVTECLRGCGAGNVILMLDACRYRGSKSGLGIGNQAAEIARQKGVVTFFSCSPNQLSYEIETLQQGIFTKAVLEGLGIQGKCATVERLNHYLSVRVPELIREHKGEQVRQTPYCIVEPVTKSHLIICPQYASLQDVSILKNDAYQAELNKDYALAKQLWIRVLAASTGDMEAINGIQRIALSKQEHPKFATSEPSSATTSKGNVTPELTFDIVQEIPKIPVLKQECPKSETSELDSATTSKGNVTPKLTFDIVKLDGWGKEKSRLQGQAEFFSEDLGNGVNLVMVAIPGGRFRMGSPETEEGRSHSESPQHEVAIFPFFLAQFSVTQAQWKKVATLPRFERDLDPDPSHFKGQNRPVEQVSWEDALEFCRRLSQATKRNYRLPSEAEWEYACRAGTTGPFHFGESINTNFANYDGKSRYGSSPKGTYRHETTPMESFGSANAFGLCDMHGNVWEWCQDVWHHNYCGAPTDGTAWEYGGGDNPHRVRRGGSWCDLVIHCRSANRFSYSADGRWREWGFRVAVASVSPSSDSFVSASAAKQSESSLSAKFILVANTISTEADVHLTSERGVNYKNLRDLLAKGEWKKADQETARVMVQIVSKKGEWLSESDMTEIPLQDLRIIDQLWVKYSEKRFGFSVQKRIWESVNQDWRAFCDRVGWRTQDRWILYENLIWSTSAPEGHHPSFGRRKLCWGDAAGILFSRMETDKL